MSAEGTDDAERMDEMEVEMEGVIVEFITRVLLLPSEPQQSSEKDRQKAVDVGDDGDEPRNAIDLRKSRRR